MAWLLQLREQPRRYPDPHPTLRSEYLSLGFASEGSRFESELARVGLGLAPPLL